MSCYQKTLIFATFTCLYFFSAHFTERHLQKISSALKSFCLNVGLWFWLLKLKRSRDRAKWRCCSYLFSALIQECHLGSQAFLMASILSFFNYALKPSQNGRDSGRAFKNRWELKIAYPASERPWQWFLALVLEYTNLRNDFRQFWRKTIWWWTIWRKVQFDEIFLTKDNLTKYLKFV